MLQINNFREYQRQINQAEIHLTRGEKAEALAVYSKLLPTAKGNFTKDLFNAMLVASELENTDLFYNLLELLLPKRIPSSHILLHPSFQSYHDQDRWTTFIDRNDENTSQLNPTRLRIDSLRRMDQLFRVKNRAYELYGDTISSIDSLNVDFLLSLIDQGKFPSEQTIGTDGFRGRMGYDVIFHHYTQSCSKDKTKPKLTGILMDLARNGAIMPNKAAHWMDMQQGDFRGGVFDVITVKHSAETLATYRPDYSRAQRLSINAYRRLICAESLEDYYAKVKFKLEHPDSQYIFGVITNVFELDEATAQIVTRGMVKIQ